MTGDDLLTTGQVSEYFGVPAYRIRRAVDALGAELPRAAAYRLVPRVLLPFVREELERRGWLPKDEEPSRVIHEVEAAP